MSQKRDRWGRFLPKPKRDKRGRFVKQKSRVWQGRPPQRDKRGRYLASAATERKRRIAAERELERVRKFPEPERPGRLDLDLLRAAYPDLSQDEILQLAVLSLKMTGKTPDEIRAQTGVSWAEYLSEYDWESYYDDAEDYSQHEIYELFYYGSDDQ